MYAFGLPDLTIGKYIVPLISSRLIHHIVHDKRVRLHISKHINNESEIIRKVASTNHKCVQKREANVLQWCSRMLQLMPSHD